MKINKVEEKPMDIHVKQEKRIDIHMKKKPDIKDRLKGGMQTDSSGKGFKALKDSFMQQEQSIKMKDRSLFLQKGSMAAEVGRAGMERMSEEVEGGDEIRDAAYTAGYVLSPVKQTAQNISQQGAELVRKKFRKKISEKQKQRLKRVDVKKKMLIKSTENTAKEAAKRSAKAVVKGTAKTAAQETSKETAKAIATETAKATAEVAATVGTEAAATTAGSSCGPVGALIGIGAGAVIGYEVGKKMEEADSRRTIRMRKIKWFIDKTRSEEEQKDSLFKMIRDITARKILEKIKVSLPIIGLLAFLLITTLISVVAPIVLTLGVAYNSPLAIFFPMPETGYEDPRTVLSGYYMEFNQNIVQLEENGETVTYCNTNNGAPISNYNDTLAVYMILYGDGQAGYVMDDAGKQHLREVFDEMNYTERTTVSVETQIGDSIGTAWVTGYCPCSICCGPYANGITASGATATPNHTIAVDAYNPIVPMGTKVVVDGVEYTVEDTGDLNHYGNDFDVYFATHNEALQWGRKNIEVYLAEGNTNTVMVTRTSTLVHHLTYQDYIDKGTLNEEQISLLTDMMDADTWNAYYSSSVGQSVATQALSKVGCRYDQSRRMEEGIYDCSSLVYRLYLAVGITLPSTAGPQGEYCFENAMIINKEDLMPGDLIFFTDGEDNDTFRNISHVAIYVGNNQMVHAAGKKRGVVLDPLRNSGVVFYARPYR